MSAVEGNVAEKVIVLGAGRTLFRQGEKGGDLFFLKSGTVELSIRNEETGTDAIVATITAKAVIGTMSFLEGDPRSATAITKTEVKYVTISFLQREKLLKQIPVWLAILLKDLSSSLRNANEAYLKLKTDGETERKQAAQTQRAQEELASRKEKFKVAEAEWKTKEEKYQKEIADLKANKTAAKTPAPTDKNDKTAA